MNFLGIGPMELLLILVVALIVFGPGKLPEIGGTLGKGIREFRRASQELTDELTREIQVAERDNRSAAKRDEKPAEALPGLEAAAAQKGELPAHRPLDQEPADPLGSQSEVPIVLKDNEASTVVTDKQVTAVADNQLKDNEIKDGEAVAQSGKANSAVPSQNDDELVLPGPKELAAQAEKQARAEKAKLEG